MSRRRLHVRKFLNLPGFHAAAYVYIEVRSAVGDDGLTTDVTFKMTDCFDGIRLDFDMDTPANRRNSLYKARVLREAMTRFEAVLQAEAARHEESQRRAS